MFTHACAVLANPLSPKSNAVPLICFVLLSYWGAFLPLYIVEKFGLTIRRPMHRFSRGLVKLVHVLLKLQRLYFHVGCLTAFAIMFVRYDWGSIAGTSPFYFMFLDIRPKTLGICFGVAIVSFIVFAIGLRQH